MLLPDSNSWGAIQMGVLPDRLPAMQAVGNGATPKFEALWGAPLPAEPGLDTRGILEGCVSGKIKTLYVMGSDLMKSFPDKDLARAALEKVPSLIVQDMFLTETGQLASVFLPTCSFIEKDGSFTNIEGRVQKFKKAVEPRGQSKPDWQIISEILSRLGKPVPYFSPRDVAREIAQSDCDELSVPECPRGTGVPGSVARTPIVRLRGQKTALREPFLSPRRDWADRPHREGVHSLVTCLKQPLWI